MIILTYFPGVCGDSLIDRCKELWKYFRAPHLCFQACFPYSAPVMCHVIWVGLQKGTDEGLGHKPDLLGIGRDTSPSQPGGKVESS
jgi:hypothetical protein